MQPTRHDRARIDRGIDLHSYLGKGKVGKLLQIPGVFRTVKYDPWVPTCLTYLSYLSFNGLYVPRKGRES